MRFTIAMRTITASLVVNLLFSGCGEGRPAFLTRPPKIPVGYIVFYAKPYSTTVMWKAKPDVIDSDGRLLDRNKVLVRDVLRVGVQKGIIFGMRENTQTKVQSAFFVDTNANTATLDIKTAESNNQLKTHFSITDFTTVPAHFY